MEQFKRWLTKKIHETPTGEMREHYTDVQLVIGEFERELESEKWKEEGIVPPDFTQGRTFGIKGNVRKAIVLDIDSKNNEVKWTFVTSTHHLPAINTVEKIVECCTGVGPIDLELLASIKKEIEELRKS